MYIYILIDPKTYRIKYVGKTENLRDRYIFHLRDRRNAHKWNWINGLKSENLLPLMKTIEICSLEDSSWYEMWWIAYGKSCGWKLTNKTNGGEGTYGYRHTEEAKNKIAERSRNQSSEQVEKHRQRMIGKRYALGNKHTEEHKAYMREKQTGRIVSKETREKLSESRKHIIITDEWRTNISKSMKGKQHWLGKKHTEESKKKISEAKKGQSYGKGRKASDETRRKLSESHRGISSQNKKLTDEDVLKVLNLLDMGMILQHIAELFGVSRTLISNIKTGKARRDVSGL